MSCVPLLLAVLALPRPQDPTPSAPQRLDVVELSNGERIEGRIVTSIDGYVELALPGGGTVGFGGSQVRQVLRGAGELPGAPRPTPQVTDQWFVLHDAQGRAVGWLHSTVQVDSDGLLRLGEEWEFVSGRRRTAVSLVERASLDLQPVSAYYRERVADDGERHLREERIVEATLQGDTLRVQRLALGGRAERQLPAPPGTTFPLLAMHPLRAGRGPAGPTAVTVFDPGTEELGVRTLEPPRTRTVPVDGSQREVMEVASSWATGRNAEWLDASHRALRREIAGPSLVALPSTAEAARRAAESALGGAPAPATLPPALVVEQERRFGLWLPNPAWTAADDKPQPGQAGLRSVVHDARVTLALLDHLDAGTTLPAAADAVARWLVLLHPDLEITARTQVRVRGRDAIRLDARQRTAPSRRTASVHVLPHRAAFVTLTCVWPSERTAELAADLDYVLRTVELDPEGVEPPLQGPVKPAPR